MIKKLIILTLLPMTVLMAGSFVMSKGRPLVKTETSIPASPNETVQNEIIYEHTITVNSFEKLQNAVKNAHVSTKIIIADGTYNSKDIILEGNSAPVYIIASQQNHTIIQKKITLKGNNITISSLKFNGGDEAQDTGGAVYVEGSNVHITRCLWDDSQARVWIRTMFSALNTEISYCTFQNKNNNRLGTKLKQREVVQFRLDYKNLEPRNHYIHHCYWKNIPNGKFSNAYESLHIVTIKDGVAYAVRGAQQNIRVEYNLFEDVHGEGEIVSIKANNIHVKYNTFKKCSGTLSFRFGNNSEAKYNSFFNGETAITLSGENHIIEQNYIENMNDEGILIREGDNYKYGYGRPINTRISYNTVINSKKGQIRIGKGRNSHATESFPPKNTLISNNILIQKDADYLIRDGGWDDNKPTLSGTIFKENIYQGVLENGFIDGFISKTPNLKLQANGIKLSLDEKYGTTKAVIITKNIAGINGNID